MLCVLLTSTTGTRRTTQFTSTATLYWKFKYVCVCMCTCTCTCVLVQTDFRAIVVWKRSQVTCFVILSCPILSPSSACHWKTNVPYLFAQVIVFAPTVLARVQQAQLHFGSAAPATERSPIPQVAPEWLGRVRKEAQRCRDSLSHWREVWVAPCGWDFNRGRGCGWESWPLSRFCFALVLKGFETL